jgi:hypothetical protein
MRKLWLALGLALFTQAALAEGLSSAITGKSGNDMKALLDSEDSFALGLAYGYIEATYELATELKLICPPSGVSNGQKNDMVKKFLNDHPERRHEHKMVLVLEAFAAPFACK